MKTIVAICVVFWMGMLARAQTNLLSEATDFMQSIGDFVSENFDVDEIEKDEVDPMQLNRFIAELESRFESTNVFELTSLRQSATNLLPVLLKFEETQPYAAWLETRLDFLDMLDELQNEVGPTNKFRGGQLPNPSPQTERKVWNAALQKRPMSARAASLLPVLKPIFISEQVPSELVWIAEVESSFNPDARSPVGAAGLFQIMPATAKSLNLSLFPKDERLQPEKCARAAAVYLRQLHKRFNDWRLVLAAYNAGETRVGRLLKSSNAKSYDAIATMLPAETQMYVPKVEATILARESRVLNELKAPRKPGA